MKNGVGPTIPWQEDFRSNLISAVDRAVSFSFFFCYSSILFLLCFPFRHRWKQSGSDWRHNSGQRSPPRRRRRPGRPGGQVSFRSSLDEPQQSRCRLRPGKRTQERLRYRRRHGDRGEERDNLLNSEDNDWSIKTHRFRNFGMGKF